MFAAALLALVAAVPLAQPVRAGTLSAALVDASGQVQRQESNKSICTAKVNSLSASLAQTTLTTTKRKALESALAVAQDCLSSSIAALQQLRPALDSSRAGFLAATSADATALDATLATLGKLQFQRANIIQNIGTAKSTLDRLLKDPVKNVDAIATTQAQISSLETKRDGIVTKIAPLSSTLASLEARAAAQPAGTVKLSWTTPTTRADGSPLPMSDIGGYTIYVLNENTGATRVVPLEDPFATSHTITGLAPATYHFSMSAIDAQGNESELSPVVSKTVN